MIDDMRTVSRSILGLVAAALLVTGIGPGSGAAAQSQRPTSETAIAALSLADAWTWPLPGAHVIVAPYRAPAHAYGPGHRGVDLAAVKGTTVVAPADGVVAFRGVVVDRALLTIRHADGLVSTLEPLESPLSPGDAVSAGDEVGIVGLGGHSAPGTVHLGVRLNGDYINPLLLFGKVPRAVLLPCCAGA